MSKSIRSFIAAAALVASAWSAQAQQLEEIKVSYQPALYWALPFYAAAEKGWWAELGLKPTFSTFPAGVPQIAAAAAKSWDVGGTGSVPAVLGAVRFNILTIGITNDESQGNSLMVHKDKADHYLKNPAAIPQEPRPITTSCTAPRSTRRSPSSPTWTGEGADSPPGR